ncbi:glycoside hydrolase family protein [Arthrobacter koreensis]|uniref:glycosyl hydrolase family 32 n=1 Tax=Arthrobacter koreensis TaxID=199136 RepID=UPI0036DA21CB
MVFRLNDHWAWDSWLADDGEQYHLFFLRASRALQDPQRRHYRASIGHAVSTDLEDWQLLPDALVAADAPAWDDLATWTGCTVQGKDGRWHLFYTGVSRAENGLQQRIGKAVSDDLVTWTRRDRPPLEADPRWYEKLGEGTWPDEAWRDPFVFWDEDSAQWHMLVTARCREGNPAGRSVVGHAVSADLEEWEVRPPLSAPAGYGEMEVIQSRMVDGQPVLIFSCLPEFAPGVEAPRVPTGTWIAPGDSLLGPWQLEATSEFYLDGIYAAQLVQKRDGEWVLFGFQNGTFTGEIAGPTPLKELTNGRPLFAQGRVGAAAESL